MASHSKEQYRTDRLKSRKSERERMASYLKEQYRTERYSPGQCRTEQDGVEAPLTLINCLN